MGILSSSAGLAGFLNYKVLDYRNFAAFVVE
jgi:hypothetical protein